jgi:hypothetical protein
VSLTVEDGTGLPDADSYISLQFFKTFCSSRNYDLASYADVDMEASLRLAQGWIDTYSRYKGFRLTPTQSLEFPRTGCFDWSSYEVTGVPLRVKHAAAELAFKGMGESLYQDQDRGGKTVSESVGPISTTYATDAPTGKVWQFAVNLLAQYVRDPKQVLGPLWTDPDLENQFTIGMNDMPGGTGGFTSDAADKGL